MALTSLEKRARDSTNLKSVPGLTIPRHALMVNQFDKRFESLRGGGGISTPTSFSNHTILEINVHYKADQLACLW